MNHITEKHPFLKDLLSIVTFIFFVILGTIFTNTFILRSFSVSGHSMETTLHPDDRLIVNRLPVTGAQLQNKPYIPNRGDIIVFKNPRFVEGTPEEYIVKRVIGFAGERVIVADGKITVYNKEHPGGFNPDEAYRGPSPYTTGVADVTVAEGTLFVSGDNRFGDASSDSRNGLGLIPLFDVIGPVSVRIFPFTAIRTF